MDHLLMSPSPLAGVAQNSQRSFEAVSNTMIGKILIGVNSRHKVINSNRYDTLRKNLGILLLRYMGYRLQSHYGGIVKLLLKKLK